MKTCDYNQVKEFAAEINAELDECENDEGIQCHTIDAILSFCAERCCKFADTVRKWGRDVFTGKVAFDAAAEQLWKAELSQLLSRAQKLLAMGIQHENECWVLDGKRKLEASLWNLSQLTQGGWVTPKLSVGPSPRQEFQLNAADVVRMRSLPPLPQDWKPSDPRQATLFPIPRGA